MNVKEISLIPKGMNQDTDISKSNGDHTFENINVKLINNATQDLVVDTFIGYSEYLFQDNYNQFNDFNILGEVLGIVPIPEGALVFSKKDNTDYIYLAGDFNRFKKLVSGNLNFKKDSIFEGIYFKEGEDLEKVYWVDGVNPPRVINIKDPIFNNNYINSEQLRSLLEFNHYLYYTESVYINKRFADGSFHSGTVQYFFTYIDDFGKESSIFASSSIYYSTPEDGRGGSPEETCTNVFDIYLNNLNNKKVRIYSLHRTSLNTTPSAYIVADIEVNSYSNISYTDNNREVTAIDPTLLLYLGCEYFIPKTIAIKDNTIFFGNYTIPKISVDSIYVNVKYKKSTPIPIDIKKQLSLAQRDITFLKRNEEYRAIIQFLNFWGKPVGYSKEFILKNTNSLEVDKDTFTPYIPVVSFNTNKLDSRITGARVLIHYPEGSERKVITQGIASPTIFNLRDRLTDSPFSQSSWFFRGDGLGIPSAHGYPIGMWKSREQGSYFNEIELFKHPSYKDFDLSNYEDYRKDTMHLQMFGIDRSIITINSPEIDDNFVFSGHDLELNLVGLCRITEGHIGFNTDITEVEGMESFKGDYSLPSPYTIGSFPLGVSKEKEDNIPIYPLGSIFNRIGSIEGYSKRATKNLLKTKSYYSYRRSRTTYDVDIKGSLVDCIKVDSTEEKLYKLDGKFYKGTINTIVSNDLSSIYTDQNFYTTKTAFESNLLTPTYIFDTGIFERPDAEFYNTKAVPITYKSTPHLVAKIKELNGAPILGYAKMTPPPLVRFNRSGKIEDSERDSYKNNFLWNIRQLNSYLEGVKIKTTNGLDEYKPSYKIKYKDFSKIPYTVLEEKYLLFLEDILNDNGYTKVEVVNNIIDVSTLDSNSKVYSIIPYEKSSIDKGFILVYPVVQASDSFLEQAVDKLISYHNTSTISDSDLGYNYDGIYYNIPNVDSDETPLFIVDIINKNSSRVLGDITWNIASKVHPISGNRGNMEIPILGGDTYFQIFDCIKTLPFKDTDYNKMTEALSVALETRVNIYGRYDKNIGAYRYGNLNENNFNRINPVYSQKDNFLTYRKIEDWKISEEFPNQITWSKTKTVKELSDSFTHITLASTMDVNGSYGSLQKILTFKDNLLFFQDRGFGVINFNSRVQIPVSDGVPIEIANTYKVDGYKYISDSVGTKIKKSIVKSIDYLYFYDSSFKEVYQFGNGLTPLTTSKGMSTIFRDNSNYGIETYINNSYYSKDGRIYFNIDKSYKEENFKPKQLVFNELLNEFESFYTYPYFEQVYDSKSYILSLDKRKYLYFANDFIKPSSYRTLLPWEITFKVNPNLEQKDRIFTNISFTLDNEKNSSQYSSFNPIKHLSVWNNYQKGTLYFDDYRTQYDITKKFNFFNIQLPRDNQSPEEDKKENRIRSPWVWLSIGNRYSQNSAEYIPYLLRSFKVKYYE